MSTIMRISSGRLCLVGLLIASWCQEASYAQTSSENYIRQTVYLDEDRTQGISTVQYFDGLGRPKQKAEGGYVTGNTDGITHYLYTVQEYDSAGRASTNWLPMYSGGSTPGILTEGDVVSFSSASYNQDSHAYSTTSYDGLDRPLFVTTPGDAWNQGNKGRVTTYRGNDAGEVRLYYVENELPKSDSCYRKNTLYCTECTDEDGIKTLVFKDKSGRLVLERRGVSNPLDTYHVYDERGRLRFVLPPKYQTDPSIGDLAYCYEYDSRGRTISRKMPGCSKVRYFYNDADQLCYEQDGEMLKKGLFRFYLYDKFGRMAVQGTCVGEPTALKEDVCTAAYMGSGAGEFLSTGYCLSEGQTLGSASVESVNYYDHYSFLFKFEAYIGMPIEEVTGDAVNHRGLLTGTLLKDNGGTAPGTLVQDSRLVINCYDKKSRLSTSFTLAFGRHATKLHNEYSYCGDLASSTRGYYRYGTSGLELADRVTVENTYYSGTRMLKRTRTSYASPSQNKVLEDVAYTYDELGHVIKRDRIGTGSDMNYTYNLLNGTVNCIKVEGDSGFIQNIYRETGTSAPRYNGSISAMTWKIPGETSLRKYNYTYDELNRLTRAVYSELLDPGPIDPGPITSTLGLVPACIEESEPGASRIEVTPFVTDLYGEEIAYDENSNITSLRRMGATNTRRYGLIDDLSFTYQGNRRVTVQDEAGTLSYSGASDFVDGADSEEEYEYDDNGALTMDLNRGITSIEYDNLGNPKKITFTDNRSIEYVYSADGIKFRAIHKKPGLTAWTHYGGTVVLTWRRDTADYIGNLILKNSHPEMLQFDGGYASFSHDTIDGLHYYIQDYQGNNRMVLSSNGTIEQVTHYYPYGGVIGDISTNENLQKYKFEGKELDRTFGLDNYDIHARQYFAMAPMWDRIDSLAEKYYSISPYAYCGGDPVNLGDYDGKQFITFMGTSNPIMLGTNEVLVNSRNPLLYSSADKISVAGKVPHDPQVHHLIPKQLKMTEEVQQAIKQGFKFEGKENKITLERYSKIDGKGQHGNHPKYNTQVKRMLKNISKSEKDSSFIEKFRDLVNKIRKKIVESPDSKINDLKF